MLRCKNKTSEQGAITVEATISLSAFMFMIVTVLTIVNICIVQTKIGIAIHCAAKEISQYSYLYALTGIPESQQKLAAATTETSKTTNEIMSDINTVFTEIQNLGNAAGRADATDISGLLSEVESSVQNMGSAGSDLKDKLEALAEDPQKVAFALAKIAVGDGLNLVQSRLIAAPLAKAMCKKNLVAEKGGDVETYLKSLGVVPGASGTYLSGLDFSGSTLFPNGSNEICIRVTYDVKVIALLPIDFSFTFNQSAITQGWFAGENSYRTVQDRLQVTANNTVWQGGLQERVDLIRHQGISEYTSQGYGQVCGSSYQHVQVYSETNNEFVGFTSMNPLYSAPGDRTLTLDDLNDTALRDQIKQMCAGVSAQTERLDEVTVKKKGANGQMTKSTYDCSDAKTRVIITIPEDDGLKERMESIVAGMDTYGVVIEFNASYGKGAQTSVVSQEDEKQNDDSN